MSVLVHCSITKMMNRSRPLLYTIHEIKAYMSTNNKIQNHYEVLNVAQNSTQDDIKSAYYDLTKKYHPDKNTSKDAKANFQKVSAAYEVLGNFAKRKQYDRDLMARGRKATVTSASQAASYGVRRSVEVDPLAAFYRSRLGNDPQSPLYNFDDWTRAHYGRALRRSLEEREARNLRQKDRIKEHKEDIEESKVSNRVLGTFIVISLITMTIHDYFKKNEYDQSRLIGRETREASLQNLKKSSD